MKRIFNHWPYWVTGPVLAVFLIIFWYSDQSYLTAQKSPVVVLLENPLLTFGLIMMGAFFSSLAGREFSLKLPANYQPLIFSFVGGMIMGAGSSLAAMSVHSLVLFNLAGIFNLTAFMVTKGWVYAAFMILGGFVGSRIFVRLILKTAPLNKDFILPKPLCNEKIQKIVLLALCGLFLTFVAILLVLAPLPFKMKGDFILAMAALVVFGMIVERGTVCMSSMLKEWFLAHGAYVWRTVLFTIMCLALFYQAGIKIDLYPPFILENRISHLGWLIAGSFLMGAGFIFADGCFIGSLWKAGQGNLINVVGIFGILVGTGIMQVIMKLFPVAGGGVSMVPNYLGVFVAPFLFLILLWSVGVVLFTLFKPIRYDY